MTVTRPTVPVSSQFPPNQDVKTVEKAGLSALARGLVGSEILKIAADIRELQAAGREICNLTVGDFSPSEFRIPSTLESSITEGLSAGQTNYPPSDGVLALRKEVASFYERGLGLSYPVESVLIAGGARPLIYATYKSIVDPGEKVLYPVPSWNNNHYTFLASAEPVEVIVGPETNFLPTAEMIAPVLDSVRLICINTPLNPTGTVLSEREVRAIGQLVVEENIRRRKAGRRALYIMWDQVYWMLTFGDARHCTPPELVPESAAWTILIDGISKSFAATGLRVGWSLAPPYVTARMRDILGHVGAWAPRPEQVATAKLLSDHDAITSFHTKMIGEVRQRLDRLHDGFQTMKRDGLPVDSIAPQGAIYLTARVNLAGCSLSSCDGQTIGTNEDIRQLLLDGAGMAVVPFQAFGLREETGWMRLSVGATSRSDIDGGLERVQALLARG
jgi:aspartate aminotransferase